jgi:thymidine phosphorylase
MRLGAGRERQEDTVDPGVGISLVAKVGDRVETGQPLCRFRYRHEARLTESLRLLADSWRLGDASTDPGTPLVAERIA